MQLYSNGLFLGSENIVSKKTGECYTYLGFAIGMDSLRLMAPANFDVKGLEMHKAYKLNIDYNLSFKSFRLVSVEPVK